MFNPSKTEYGKFYEGELHIREKRAREAAIASGQQQFFQGQYHACLGSDFSDTLFDLDGNIVATGDPKALGRIVGQSEALAEAQNRIKELEQEVERLRKLEPVTHPLFTESVAVSA